MLLSTKIQEDLAKDLLSFQSKFPSLKHAGNTPIDPSGAGLTYTEEAAFMLGMISKLSKYADQLDMELKDFIIKYRNELEKLVKEFNKNIYETLVKRLDELIASGEFDAAISRLIGLFDDVIGDTSKFRDFEKTLIEKVENEFRDRCINARWFGAKFDGVTDDTDSLQDCADYCFKHGKLMYAEGITKISKTLYIECNADLGQLEINFYGEVGSAIFLGNKEKNSRENGVFIVGEIINKGTRFNATKGLEICNINRWKIEINGIIKYFGKGLFMTAKNYGCAYNNIYWNSIINNKINIEILATKTGWVNENTFFGGSGSHTTENGFGLQDFHNIKIHLTDDSPYLPDNNTFYSPSLEGSVPEYPIYIHGQNNMIFRGRFEAHGGQVYKVAFVGRENANSVGNIIFMGYGVNSIKIFSKHARGNTVGGLSSLKSESSGDRPAVSVKNGFDSNSPSVRVHGPNQDINDVDPLNYTIDLTASRYKGKDQYDSFDRVQIRNYNGSIALGDGTKNPDKLISSHKNGVAFNDGIVNLKSTWEDNVLQLGGYNIWIAANGYPRIKWGKPTSDMDGTPLYKP